MEKYKIFGPPGTGKTTYLLTLLERELTSVAPARCAFVSFTRKGAYEGASRAQERFALKEGDLTYFKTIHSLCFSALGAKRDQMLSAKHYKQFSEATGLRFLGHYTEEFTSVHDQYLFAQQLLRNNRTIGERFIQGLDIKKYKWVNANFAKYKRQLGLLDFTDLLEQYLAQGTALPVDVAFIDEAQDLTSLQWAVVKKLFANVQRLYVAGDDDQAIYEWSGADVEAFLGFEGKETVLNESYRLPEAVYNVAQNVTRYMHNRREKQFKPNGVLGEVEYKIAIDHIDIAPQGDVLILARNNCFLDVAEEHLRNQGMLFLRKGEPSISKRLLTAIKMYEAHRKGQGTVGTGAFANYFTTIEEKQKPWYDVINLAAPEINYYRRILKLKRAETKPTIRLETIHSSKGGEADHVILMLDATRRVYENFMTFPDSELRCLYVGATRAKKKLSVILGSKNTAFSVEILRGE